MQLTKTQAIQIAIHAQVLLAGQEALAAPSASMAGDHPMPPRANEISNMAHNGTIQFSPTANGSASEIGPHHIVSSSNSRLLVRGNPGGPHNDPTDTDGWGDAGLVEENDAKTLCYKSGTYASDQSILDLAPQACAYFLKNGQATRSAAQIANKLWDVFYPTTQIKDDGGHDANVYFQFQKIDKGPDLTDTLCNTAYETLLNSACQWTGKGTTRGGGIEVAPKGGNAKDAFKVGALQFVVDVQSPNGN